MPEITDLSTIEYRNTSLQEHPIGKNVAQKFWEDRLRDNLNESGTGCSGIGLQFNRWLYRLRAHRFRQILTGLTIDPDKTRVLDVGSGAGFYIRQWRLQGVRQLEGLDFSKSSVGYLQAAYPECTFHLADVTDPDLAVPSARYDIITAFDVLFHIVDDEDYRAALNNLCRMLKPGGVLIFSENFTHHEHARGGNYHYSRTLLQIGSMLEEAGLQLDCRRPMFILMNAPDDSTSRLLHACWRRVRFIAQRGEMFGWIMGAILYPVDRVLTVLLNESPTTEIAICRRQRQWEEG